VATAKPLENDCVVVVKGKTAFEQAYIGCQWLAAGYNKPNGQTHQRPRWRQFYWLPN